MKKKMTSFLATGMIAMGLASCGKKEKELAAKESELEEELDQKRKKLNEVVRRVDELETQDQSEKLVDVNLKFDALTRELEFEKTEQEKILAEEKEFEVKLEKYQAKYPLGGK